MEENLYVFSVVFEVKIGIEGGSYRDVVFRLIVEEFVNGIVIVLL